MCALEWVCKFNEKLTEADADESMKVHTHAARSIHT